MPKASRTEAAGWVNPMARSTRSALTSNSLPGISLGLPSFHSRRTAFRPVSLPFLPTNSLVATDQSRSQPSSWEEELRNLFGQKGQVRGLFSRSGGFGSSSNWVTLTAPWRLAVPTQSEPVSPPQMTTTFLPAALIG